MAHGSYDVRGMRVAAVAVALLLGGSGCAESQSTPTAGRPSHAVHRTTAPTGHRTSAKPKPRPKPGPPRPTAEPSRPNASPTRRPSGAALVSGRQLRRLVVRPRPHGTLGYDRDAFGESWADTDGNGCNQRDDVLLRDAVRGTVRVGRQGACNHDVLAGTWHDPYTGRILRFTDLKDLRQAEAIQIDHIVPLAEAWVSGAVGWSSDRREAFANDLRELLAVDGPTNMSKGDGDPATWRPRRGYQCSYARQWIAIKSAWRLAVDPSEVAALRQMLGYCR